jgi:signal transduction histidine kinase
VTGDETIEACIRERERIGHAIHDTIQQDLVGARLLLYRLHCAVDCRDVAEAREIIACVSGCIDRAVAHTRRLTRGLTSDEVDATEMPEALAVLCKDTAEAFAVNCTCRTHTPPSSLTTATATHLYYIVKEALWNAIQHGKAEQVKVLVRFRDGGGVLVVADNGGGVQYAKTDGFGLGLRIMKHRAEQMNGELTVGANRRGGTRVRCTFGGITGD